MNPYSNYQIVYDLGKNHCKLSESSTVPRDLPWVLL